MPAVCSLQACAIAGHSIGTAKDTIMVAVPFTPASPPLCKLTHSLDGLGILAAQDTSKAQDLGTEHVASALDAPTHCAECLQHNEATPWQA